MSARTRRMSEIVCTVICRLPSPSKRIVRAVEGVGVVGEGLRGARVLGEDWNSDWARRAPSAAGSM